jgi:hypothetical protein
MGYYTSWPEATQWRLTVPPWGEFTLGPAGSTVGVFSRSCFTRIIAKTLSLEGSVKVLSVKVVSVHWRALI